MQCWAEVKVPYYFGLLAHAETAAGRPAVALSLLAQALGRVEETDERWFAAELWRLRGETLLVDSADPSEVEGCFRTAMEIAEAQRPDVLLRARRAALRLRPPPVTSRGWMIT
jgi:predicted ATPase